MKQFTRFMIPLNIVYIIFTVVVVLLIPGPVSADRKPRVTKLVLQPAPEPRPALKYQLLPEFMEQTPGNAALEYTRVIIEWQSIFNDDLIKQIGDWSYETPLEKLPRDEVRTMLSKHKSILDGLVRASQREHCDWQLPLHDMNPMSIMLAEVQNLRYAKGLLMVKARLEIAEGKHKQAVKTLQTGYAISRHIAESPFLISALVGMSTSRYTSAVVEELIAQPGSPNLYWALTNLPSPIIDIRKAAAAEMNMLYLAFPELRNIDKIPETPERWRELLVRIGDYVHTVELQHKNKQKIRLGIIGLVSKLYPECKSILIDGGLSPEKVEAMPIAKVVVQCVTDEYNDICDDMLKWFALPYWQAENGLNQVTQRLSNPRKRGGTNVLAAILLPALSNSKISEALAERSIALLRTIEAIRLYAAAHEGRLPKILEEITSVPLPIDPFSGKPFEYQLKGKTGIIRTPVPKNLSGSDLDRIIEITIAK